MDIECRKSNGEMLLLIDDDIMLMNMIIDDNKEILEIF